MHWIFLAVVLVLFVYHRTPRDSVPKGAVVSALVVGAFCVVVSFSLSPRDDGLPHPMLVLGGGLVTGGVLALGGWGIWRVARQPGGGRRILRGVVGWLLLLGIVGVLGAGLVLVGWVAWQAWLLPSLPQVAINSLLWTVGVMSLLGSLMPLATFTRNCSMWQLLREEWREFLESGCFMACLTFVCFLLLALSGQEMNQARLLTFATFAVSACGVIILLAFGLPALWRGLGSLLRLKPAATVHADTGRPSPSAGAYTIAKCDSFAWMVEKAAQLRDTGGSMQQFLDLVQQGIAERSAEQKEEALADARGAATAAYENPSLSLQQLRDRAMAFCIQEHLMDAVMRHLELYLSPQAHRASVALLRDLQRAHLSPQGRMALAMRLRQFLRWGI